MVAEGALRVCEHPGVSAVHPTFTAYVEMKPTKEVDTITLYTYTEYVFVYIYSTDMYYCVYPLYTFIYTYAYTCICLYTYICRWTTTSSLPACPSASSTPYYSQPSHEPTVLMSPPGYNTYALNCNV